MDTSGIKGLIERIVPGHENMFVTKIIPSADGNDVFELFTHNGKVVLSGNNANAQAMALGWYLKYFCRISVPWYADVPLEVPDSLPAVPEKVRKVSSFKYRFMLNYCTFAYTFPFWKWPDWQRFIDWMALNGVNMPLAITGIEKILQQVWKEYGIPEEEMRKMFTGPAYLPFFHMNIISGWDGPLPQEYIDHNFEMQKRILARERSLGMKPVLPAFSGQVPRKLKEIYPDKKITVLGTGWGRFDKKYDTWFIDTYDPLFMEIQASFLRKMTAAFGTDHVYGIDPFNELTPPSWDKEYLHNTGKRIYQSIADVDPEAIWLQMAWLFYFDRTWHENDTVHWTDERLKAYITSTPPGKMILLDYYCELAELWRDTKSFFGVPFIWSFLGNFGGREVLYGPAQSVRDKLFAARREKGGNMVGMGSTLEGLGVNQVVFEFLFELAWENEPPDMQEWFSAYAGRRGEQGDDALRKGWQLLQKNVYSTAKDSNIGGSVFHSRPLLNGVRANEINMLGRNYTPGDLMKVWKSFMNVTDKTRNRDTFRYDLVNVIRQYLDDFALPVRDSMKVAFLHGDKELFQQRADHFLQIILDQDRLLATRPEFLLGKWLNGAREFGNTPSEKDLLDMGARNIITTWGPNINFLMEYSNRDWAGLTRDYYYKRWKMFVGELSEALEEGRAFDEEKFDKKVAEFEWHWITEDKTRYSSVPTGDSWEIAKTLFEKYKKLHPVYCSVE